MDKGFRLL